MFVEAHLEVARHEDAHDGKAAEAHPDGSPIELPGGALIIGAHGGQVGRGRPVRHGRADTGGVCNVVGVHLAVHRAATYMHACINALNKPANFKPAHGG